MQKAARIFLSVMISVILTIPLIAKATDSTPCPASATTSAVDTPTTPQPQSVSVRLNELLPNPVGDDTAGEFIELANVAMTAADLTDWTITDPKGKTFTLATTITAGGFLSLPYSLTKIALTNSGSTITLKNAAGLMVDIATYAEPVKEGSAFARSATGEWTWSATPTPGAANAFPAPADASLPITDIPTTPAADQPSPSSASETETPQQAGDQETNAPCPCAISLTAASVNNSEPPTYSLLDAVDLPDGTPLAVAGTVTLAPGVAGKTLFAIQDESGGAFVKISGSGAPTLKAGEMVALTGKLHKLKSGPRITASARDIQKTGAVKLAYADRTLGELETADIGQAVMIEGIVAKIYKKSFTVTDGDGSNLHVAAFDAPPPVDSPLRVFGVISPSANGIELLVPNTTSIHLLAQPTAPKKKTADAPAMEKDVAHVFSPASASQAPKTPYAIAGILTATAVGVAVLRKKILAAAERH